MISRRGLVVWTTGIIVSGMAGRLSAAQRLVARLAGTPITVYKSRTCGCCAEWVDHLREHGFTAAVQDTETLDELKDELGVPKPLRSCHTAVVEKYLVEGHVPASDIRRLLAQRPPVAGLAAPGMPARSPGMAEPGAKPEGYDVLAFQADGSTQVFSRY